MDRPVPGAGPFPLSGPARLRRTGGPAQAAHEAAQYAMQYGGAVSVQYALWENGEVTLQGHDGVYSKTENRALTDDDLYGIGSISKTYTAPP